MGYKPKSKVNIKETTGKEFIFMSSRHKAFSDLNERDYYRGFYIETSGGKYYAGKNILYTRIQLIKPDSDEGVFGDSIDVKNYIRSNSFSYKKLKNTTDIYGHKNTPTEFDYQKGYFTRYFIKKVNEKFGYVEVNKEVFSSIRRKNQTHDPFLYKSGNIHWSLIGNVHRANQLNIQRKERVFPYISTLFPLFNEFQKPDLQVQEDLNTIGNELYHDDGKEYMGAYHIHPVEGPMEGPKHIDSSHARLYYSQNIPKIEINIGSKISDEAFEKWKKEKDILASMSNALKSSIEDPLTKEEKEQKTKEQKEARQEEIDAYSAESESGKSSTSAGESGY